MDNEINEQVLEEADDTLLGEGNVEVTEETTVQNTGLTQDQIREIMREERQLTAKQVAEETAKAFRAMQSMSDKKADQVRSMAEQQVDMMAQAGAQITPDMRENYVNMLVNRYKKSVAEEAPEPAQDQSREDTGSNPLFDAAVATVQRTATKLGVQIEPADFPEFDNLWKNVSNPKTYQQFLDKAETYLEAKAKSVKTPPQARIPSLAGNSGSSKPTEASYIKEVMAHSGDMLAIQEIQKKYTGMGLDISQVKFTQSRK